jgi:predicted permease
MVPVLFGGDARACAVGVLTMPRSFRLFRGAAGGRRDVDDEIQLHIALRAEEFAAAGLAPDAARRAAEEAFGDVASIAAACRDIRGRDARGRARRAWVSQTLADVKLAWRGFGRHPGFAAASLLTLTLGIGAAATVFTIANGVLLRPLPYHDPSRLAMLWLTTPASRSADGPWPLSAQIVTGLTGNIQSLDGISAFRSSAYTLRDEGEPEALAGARVAASLFATLGIRPELGRTFTPDESVAGGPAVVILSDRLWRRRFGGSPTVLGRQITLGSVRYTVIGVMPHGFEFPRGAELPSGLSFAARTELWTPLSFTPLDLANLGTLNLAAVARVKQGVTYARMNAEIGAVSARLWPSLVAQTGGGVYGIPVAEQAAARVRRDLLLLLGAGACVLLITCVNVTNILIARTAMRQPELAVREALGASGGRIARQLVTENLVLALAGAGLGLLAALWGTSVVLALVPGSLPRADDVTLDWRVIGATLLVAASAGCVFGLLSARFAARQSIASSRVTAGRSQRRGRRLLVVSEVALSLMLLIAAGLLLESFVKLERLRPGFVPSNALSAMILVPTRADDSPARDGARWASFFDALTTRVAALPGVQAAGAVSSLPLSGDVESGGFTIDGAPAPAAGQAPSAQYSVVSGDYFKAIGIQQTAGRLFDSRDRADAPPVAVISRAFARQYFPSGSPIGARINSGFDYTPQVREIVGVVDDVRQTALDAGIVPEIYVPQSQMPYPALALVVRTTGDPMAVLPGIRRELARLEPATALDRVRTLNAVVGTSLERQRFSLVLVASFAGAALALAIVGLYGVIALGVRQRRRELGVRMALGAAPADVRRLIVAEGMAVAAGGIIVGLAGAFALMRLLGTLLYDVTTTDPAIYGAAVVLVAAVAALATSLPARDATAIDPAGTLRAD